VDVNNLSHCTRQWFGWANAMLVALTEASTGIDCSIAAERQRLAKIMVRPCKWEALHAAAAEAAAAQCSTAWWQQPRKTSLHAQMCNNRE